MLWVNALRPEQNGQYFADDLFKCIMLNENDCILIQIRTQFIPKGPIVNKSALVQEIA